jgi:hypothetical protein
VVAGGRRGKDDRKQNTLATLGQSCTVRNSAHIFLFVFNVLTMIDYKEHIIVTTDHA